MRSPISRPIKQQAIEQVDVLTRRHRLASDEHTRARVRARIASLDEVWTHDNVDAVEVAAEAVARAVLLVERAQAEHDDAHASDRALTVARVRLVESSLLLEALAHVRPHANKIADVRKAAGPLHPPA